VSVINSTTIAATTPPAKVGSADVIVRLGGRAAALPGGFTYVQVKNAPPVISSVTARGARPNEPSHFADLNEEIDVMATISDAETTLDELTYQWSADVGTFTGSGRAVKWRAPGSLPTTPADYALTLTVTEQYRTTDESGAVVTIENRVTGRATVHVHNSLKEVSDLAYQFLTDFSNSAASPDFVVRNFSTDGACGRRQERDEISDNRAKYTINSSSLGSSPRVTFDFGGRCPMFDGRPPLRGDSCVQLACGWKSTVKATGTVQSVSGTCYLTEIYEVSPDRWKLCWSQFRGSNTLTGEPVTGLSFRQPD
jgi:hypothetical protein